jgi:phosphotransferase system enzyme I (PtsI)
MDATVEPVPTSIYGCPVSPGAGVGPVVHVGAPLPIPDEREIPEPERMAEAGRIQAAAGRVAAALRELAERAASGREILLADAMLAEDPQLVESAEVLVHKAGRTAERAVWEAAEGAAAVLAGLGGTMAERAADVRDAGRRIIADLSGVAPPGLPLVEGPHVLIAADLAPADTSLLDPSLCRGLVTEQGSMTSHTAILARSLGIPAVVAAGGALQIPEGTVVLVDGSSGAVVVNPGPGLRPEIPRSASQPPDDVETDLQVELLANVGDVASADAAVEAGAAGVGLLRTEFIFLGRAIEPSVAEQVAAYREILSRFPGQKVVVRTLDAGADKPLPFLTQPDEPNPALGVRGYRTARRHPEVLARQLRAIAEAAQEEQAEVWVMAPMITTPAEAGEFAARARAAGLTKVGIMVEIPAAVLCLPDIIEHVDFISIGTNDLAQYTMAADRTLGELADFNDPHQPAVLKLVEMACRATDGKPVGVCGEAAAIPELAAVFVGYGVTSLSVAPAALSRLARCNSIQ